MILVTGVSRSGKTSTLKALVAREPSWEHVGASGVLKDLGCPLVNLTAVAALSNQKKLIFELRRRGSIASPTVLLDGHAVLELAEGIFPLPEEIFDALAPSAIATVHDEVVRIFERRLASGRPKLEVDEIEKLQSLELQHSMAQARRLKVPHLKLLSGDYPTLSDWIKSVQECRG